MTRRTKTILAAVLALCVVTLLVLFWSYTPLGRARAVRSAVAQNVAARGGDEAWRDVSSLRLTGQMDLGEGMLVPYVLEQKRPDKMRLEFVFDGETAVQCTDCNAGWKLLPFRGRTAPEPMTEEELRLHVPLGPAAIHLLEEAIERVEAMSSLAPESKS